MLCVKCRQLLPPGFTSLTEDGENSICLFCQRETNTYRHENPDTGEVQVLSKEQIVDEYYKYLKQVKENPKVRDQLVNQHVNQNVKGK